MPKQFSNKNDVVIGACDIIDHLPDIFILVDEDGHIAMVNSTIEKILGWKPEDVLGAELEILLPPETRNHHVSIRKKFFKVPTEREMNERMDLLAWHKQGYSIPVSIKISPTFIDGEVYGIAVIRDDTLHRDKDEKLESQNENLELLLKEKNYLLGIAAHDLRNPIGVIENFSQLLLSNSLGPMTEDQDEFVKRIHQSSVFVMGLLEDLLDLSTIESGTLNLRKEKFSISEMLDEVLKANIVHAKSKGISIQVEMEGISDFNLNADKSKIHQVLHNLVDNAIKYSPGETIVRVCADLTNDEFVFSVSDQGVGIPAEDLKNLFQPFFRATNKPTGGEKSTGLGLFIVKRIIDAHGGRLKVESEDGKGSQFSFTMPLSA